MTVKEYMNALRRELYFRYNRAETKKILKERQLFFDEGIKSGKTEEFLCESLGSPRQLAQGMTPQWKPRFIIKAVVSWVAWLLLFLILWDVLKSFPFVVFGIFLVMLWFLFGGGICSLPPLIAIKERPHKLVLLHRITLSVLVVVAVYNFVIIERIRAGIFPNVTFLLTMIYVPLAIFAVLTLIGIYGFFRVQPKYYSLICHAGGGVFSVLFFYNFYISLNVEGAAVSAIMIMPQFIPYIIGAVMAVLFSAFIRWVQRKSLSFQ